MSKSAEAFRTISEVAEVLDTPAHVLRFWESRFSQIKPVKRAGGRRYYRPSDVALLGGIRKLLHVDGLTIRGVQKMLREQGVRYVAAFSGTDLEFDGAAALDQTPALAMSRAPSPAPTPELTEPDAMLSPDPVPVAEDDLFARPASPVFAGRPDQTAAATARDTLHRDRQATLAQAAPLAADTHFDAPLAKDALIPAAALLRAMTALRAGQRREGLTAVYHRLRATYERRRAKNE